MATKKKCMEMTVGLGTNEFGERPMIFAEFPDDFSRRLRNSCLLRLAADVELASGAGERWLVHVDENCGRPGVSLELADGDAKELKRGLAVLKAVVRSYKTKD